MLENGKGGRAYIIAADDGVEELNATNYDEECHECVKEEGSGRCVVEVLLPDMESYILRRSFA